MAIPYTANQFIEMQLNSDLNSIERHFEADGIAIAGPMLVDVDGLIRNSIDSINNKKAALVCILTTNGGYIEVVSRIVDVFRQHYDSVIFIVPDHAYSAGTILVMSGDEIFMDYYSRLGPIDPQIEQSDGKLLPALGYLERYEELVQKAKDGKITGAEIQVMMSCFDQAALYDYEQAKELSISLLEDWLVQYKFKDWQKTQSRGMTVTKAMKSKRAREIAKELNNTKRWHSHGRGISRDVLVRDLKLMIEDFGTDPDLDRKVRSYHVLLEDYMVKQSQSGVIHTYLNYVPYC